jgi:uncharacterized protein YecT (DUF1311 family)
MKIFALMLLTLIGSSALAQTEGDSINCEDPQTQLEMNLCSFREYEVSDRKLNELYKEVVTLMDAKSKPLLVQAQRNWIDDADDGQ